MAVGAMKVAVSLPKAVFAQVEELRHRLKLPRSATVVEALQLWLKEHEETERVAQYEAGYRRHPETTAALKAYERAATHALSKESW